MAKKKEKKAGKRMKKKELANILMDFFHTKQEEVISLKYLFAELHLTTHPLKMLCMDILADMLADDYITEVDKNKYKLNNHGIEMTGTFQRKSNGKNSFIPEGGGEPIFIAERNSAHAMNNDKVKIAFFAKRKHHDAEGEVIEILERANDTFVGTLEVLCFSGNRKPDTGQRYFHSERQTERWKDRRQSSGKGDRMAGQSQKSDRTGDRYFRKSRG